MDKKKKSFLMYLDNFDMIQLLGMEARGSLLTALFKHAFDPEYKPDFGHETNLYMCYITLANTMDRDEAKYLEACQKKAEAKKKLKELAQKNNLDSLL